ncbi:hypothetical protein CAI21_15865 [Alkalilimnicola ehrlichii]|uniref:Glycine transporter domain-containing protein n=1 Tax=Alkalilimnicola ehrlichii TaxID=351052 RepID=A0A3E0WQA1_9GAMM|nr:trimeric intracellular cation channel family protein [Alkalilimnicola ehrlichii]RFA27023.1 hypothetical protein CAI21_15865 [Alkalilimnicola ehrlichii]RFA34145.1 hypothetical protein CAL65_15995 [Alkalilimnicola ehrlichii]
MIYWLDIFGVAVFAVTGALAAGRKNLDLFGVVVLGLVTALGGGTVRDSILGATPVFWITDTAYIMVAALAALLTVAWARWGRLPQNLLPIADAVGLATFTVIGAQKALSLGVNAEIAVMMGVMTGVVGGMVRDVLCGEVPLVLRQEIYATASLFGAIIFVTLNHLFPAQAVATWIAIGAVLGLRLAAIRWNLSLPVFAHEDKR